MRVGTKLLGGGAGQGGQQKNIQKLHNVGAEAKEHPKKPTAWEGVRSNRVEDRKDSPDELDLLAAIWEVRGSVDRRTASERRSNVLGILQSLRTARGFDLGSEDLYYTHMDVLDPRLDELFEEMHAQEVTSHAIRERLFPLLSVVTDLIDDAIQQGDRNSLLRELGSESMGSDSDQRRDVYSSIHRHACFAQCHW